MRSQRSGLVGSLDKWNTYLHLQKIYRHPSREGADIVLEAPRHDPLIKWPTRGHVTVWKIYISIFMRLIANKLGRLVTLGRVFIMETRKSWETFFFFLFSLWFFFLERLTKVIFKVVSNCYFERVWPGLELIIWHAACFQIMSFTNKQ